MRILALQHVPFESPGSIAEWAAARGHTLEILHVYQRVPFPSPEDIDLLLIMGGPMGVHDEEACNWLAAEKRFIHTTIHAGKKVIGICLGAQLIAHVIGARVYPNSVKEIGWFPVAFEDVAFRHPLMQGLNPAMTVFHWHGDTFDIPEGAAHLMSSAACTNQAFLYKERVLGLQFHLEMGEKEIQRILEHCGGEIMPSTSMQEENTILAGLHNIPTCNRVLFSILDRL